MNRRLWTPVTIVLRKETADSLRYLADLGNVSQSSLIRSIVAPVLEGLAALLRDTLADNDPDALRDGLEKLLADSLDQCRAAMQELQK